MRAMTKEQEKELSKLIYLICYTAQSLKLMKV